MNAANALEALIAMEKDARAFGFEWSDEMMILEQVIDECREIREAIQNRETDDRIQEEIGDLLHSAVSLCLFAGFDVKEILSNVTAKFKGRMNALKILTQERGLSDLKGQSMDRMLELWRQAKVMTIK